LATVRNQSFIISSAEHLWRLRDFTNSDETTPN